MATKMTPTDAELKTLMDPPHGFDEAAEWRQWKLYEASRQVVAEAGKKLREVLPEGDGKDLVFEELGELLRYIRHALKPAGNVAGPAEPVAPPVPVAPPAEVPPVVPPDPPLDPNWV